MFALNAALAGVSNIPPALVSAEVRDRTCVPADGLGRAIWTSSGDLTGATVDIYYDDGGGWTILHTGLTPDLALYNMSPVPSSLDITSFRIQMLVGGLDVANSPLDCTPPFACV
jgi:hypothetical protein